MRLLLGLALFTSCVAITSCTGEGDSASSGSASTIVSGRKIELDVKGMTCDVDCPPAVQAALASVDGVSDVKVNFSTREAVVSADNGKTLSSDVLLKALADTRFRETTVKAR